VRANVDTFEAENPKEAMANFKAALAHVVKVPKTAVKRKRKRAKKNKKG
jgi:hypothetical protein